MEVKAWLLKRRPSTATLPVVTLKTAEPRRPAMPAKPGKSRNTNSVLALGPRATLDVPTTLPAVSRAVIVTVVATELGFTIATAVTTLVSSKERVLLVNEAPDSGTTTS